MPALRLPGLLPLAGLQTVLPSYLRERFVAAALSYIACGSAGELLCRRSDCRCQCQPAFPRCNCPEADIQALESSLAQLGRAWESHHSQFEESGEAGETPPNHLLALASSPGWVLGLQGGLLTMKASELGWREVAFSSTFTTCSLGSADAFSFSPQRSFRPW